MKRLLFSLLAASFVFAAVPVGAADTAGDASLAPRYAAFGFDMLGAVRAEHPNANVFISPTSIAVALAMTAQGAGGSTRTAILTTLHANGMSHVQFAEDNRELVRAIGATKAVQLSMANALWVQRGFAVKPAFADVLATHYDATAENIDFRSPEAVPTVNAWAEKHTDGRIRNLLEQVDPATVVMLTNAIAFKGKWSLPFSVKATAPHDFTTGAGAKISVPLMKHTAEYRYAESAELQAIRLPYADGSFAMYVVMPRQGIALNAVVKSLNATAFDRLIAGLQSREGTIGLPRFSIDFDATLNDALKALGMGVAFSHEADFDGIHAAPPRLAISEVRHSSFLKVDEEGTEAAASTSVGIGLTAIRVEPKPFAMIVDRPFVLAIRDERSGQLLFLGTIENLAS